MLTRIAALAVLLIGTAATVSEVPDSSASADKPSRPMFIGESDRMPAAFAGSDQVVVVGEQVEFFGVGSSADDAIVEYAWDFESDSIPDYINTQTGFTTHRFTTVGDYHCLFTVKDSSGRIGSDSRRLIVTAQVVDPGTAQQMLYAPKSKQVHPPDGVTQRYAILINGGAEDRFWTDMRLAYDMLINGYGFTASDVYLLNYNGTDPQGGNPGGMIDAPAWPADVEAAFDAVAARSDGDDEVFVLITDHGRGYLGPLSEGGKYFGYLDGRASVDPGDEPDFLESNFKLRSLATGGDYYPNCNHGLNTWQCYKRYFSPTKTMFWRNKYVSRLNNVYVQSVGGPISDNDVYIEYLRDNAAGDVNRDGYIDTSQGEVFDYDGDGMPPYDPATGAFDEGDWGAIDEWTDDLQYINTQVPVDGSPYRIFDEGFLGKLCIDLGYTGGPLHVDGRDENGAGLFDWMDVNQDGDVADTVSVDEGVFTPTDALWDDDWATLVGRLSVAKVAVVAEPCMSGGLVEDLASNGRVICSATIEDAVSWGNTFIRGFIAALHGTDESGRSVNADTNGNGYVSILEAFNYAAANDYADEMPQYDDNGDGASHTDPVPSGGDGVLGADMYLVAPGPTDVEETSAPKAYALHANVPNPFNPVTTLTFELPETQLVKLTIFDLAGREVRALVNSEKRAAGIYRVQWNGTNDRGHQMASGVYVCRMESGTFRETRLMTLVR
jgi:hypothetical protein